MYTHKSLKLFIVALFLAALVIFSGCAGTAPPINHPPTIVSLTANPQSPIEVNQSTIIICLATDQDEDILTYNWTKTGGTITGSGSTITWTAPALPGTYTITCTVSDSNGGQDSESVSIIVNDLGSVPSVSAIAITYHLFRGKEQSIINKLVKEDKIHRSNPTIIRSAEVDKSGITYAIYVEWAKFNGASGYRVYRSVNWTAFQLVYTEEASYDYEWYGFWEDDIQIGNIYSYYVIAYGPFGETTPDKIVSVDTWLPGCSLINPLDMATITNPNPTFTWSPVGVSTFPYGAIYSAESDLWVYETGGETSWWILFDGLLTNTAIYNQDGEAIPLVYGHNYVWDSWGYGYDQNGNLIAISASEEWEFYFSEGIVYRALCVGVGDYLYFPDACGNIDLPAPPYDVDRMRQTLGYCKFGLSNTEFSTISYLKDAQTTKANILQKIAFTFSGTDSNDISYFYFSGHGMRYENTSYLCPTDVSCYSPLDAYISVDELEQALSAIPGTKVVLLDSCHSGGFIGKGKEEENKILKEELIDFNKDVIDIFSLSESKSLLTTNKYKVLTSCHYYQVCYEIVPVEGDPFGVFTTALCDGCGYYGSYPADTNLDTKVSLQEAYLYIIDWVYSLGVDQDVQVYPSNSNFTIVEY